MINSIVFHLRKGSYEDILRFDYDERCGVDIGDECYRTILDGDEVTSYVVAEVRIFEGASTKEIHAYLSAKGSTRISFIYSAL